jgi:hypothetical protein
LRLTALIRKGGLQAIATATPATSATQAKEEGASVAKVATVAVANSKEAETETLTFAGAWLLHFTDADPLEVHFFPEATHAEALAAYPTAVAAEPLDVGSAQSGTARARAQPIPSCQNCLHRKRPGLVEPGYCAQRTDTPRAYGDNHPLHRLPEDGGAACNDFEDRT